MKVKELIDILNNYDLDDDVEAVGDSNGAAIQIGNYRPCVDLCGNEYLFFYPKDEITT